MTDPARPPFAWLIAAIVLLMAPATVRAQDTRNEQADVRISMPRPSRAIEVQEQDTVAAVLTFQAMSEDAFGFECGRFVFETIQTGSQDLVGHVSLVYDDNRNGVLDGEDESVGHVEYQIHDDERFELQFDPIQLRDDGWRQVLVVYHFQAADRGFWQFRLMALDYGGAEYVWGLPLTSNMLWMEMEQAPEVRVQSTGSQQAREVESDGWAEVPVATMSFQAPQETDWAIETLWFQAPGVPLDYLEAVLLSIDYDHDGEIDEEFDVGVEVAEGDETTIKTAWRMHLDRIELLQHTGRASVTFTFYVNTWQGMEFQFRLLGMRTHGEFGLTGVVANGPPITIVEPEYIGVSVQQAPGHTARTVAPDTSNHTLAWFSVEAEDAATLSSVYVRAFGSGNDNSEIQELRFVHDRNTNGIQDDHDFVIRTLGSFPVDNGGLTLNTWGYHNGATPGYLSLPPVQPVTLLLVVDFPVNVELGHDFGVVVQTVGVPAPHDTVGLPLTGPPLTVDDLVDPELHVTLLNPLDREVAPGREHHVVASLRLDSVARPSSVDNLTFRAIGDAIETVDVMSVALIRDHDGNGAVAGLDKPGGDRLLDSAVFHADNGAITLETGGITLPGGGSVQLLIVWTLATNIPDGRMIALQVTGVKTSAPILHDLPLTSAAFTVVTPAASDDPSDDAPRGTPGNTDGAGGADLADPYLSLTGTGGCTAGTGTATGRLLLALVVLALAVGVRARRRVPAGC